VSAGIKVGIGVAAATGLGLGVYVGVKVEASVPVGGMVSDIVRVGDGDAVGGATATTVSVARLAGGTGAREGDGVGT
jgi:hypothetical protein